MFEDGLCGDQQVVNRLRHTERQIAALHAEQLQLIAELYGRAPAWITAPPDTHRLVDAAEVAAAEIGVALRISRRQAMDRLGLAVQAVRDLPESLAALRAGELTLTKLRILADATADLTDEATRRVEARVLPHAPAQTPAGLGASVARAVITADPLAATRRHEQAVSERTVRLYPCPDGMASLWARLPAEHALGCFRQLCELADTAAPSNPAASEDRTADARRADTLVDLILGAGSSRWADAAPQPAPSARIDVTVAWTTLAGLDDQPAHLHGHGPITAHVARELAAEGTWRRLLTDPTTGTVLDVGTTRYQPPAAMAALVRARDRTCRWYGCRQPATRADLDHTVPYPHGPTAVGNLAALCRGHHRLKTHTRWRVDQAADGQLTWTSPTGQTATTRPWPDQPPETSAA